MTTTQFSTFVVGSHLFGIEVENVQEVIRYQPMTRVPLAPGAIGGLINLRGQVVTAIELRERLGRPPRPEGTDAVVIVVPLFVDDASWEPDFGWMDQATRSLAEHLTPGTLVSYETTLPVGTLRTRFVPMIEEISGLKESEDFFAVFSPERVLTGRVFADLRKYPKLIGAISEEGTARARAFYESALTFDQRPDLPRPNGV